MKRGIDPNRNYAVTFLGKQYDFAPLHAAAFLGRSRILDILVTAGAKATMEDNMDKETPLFYACKAGHEGSAKRLLRMHADPVAKNRKGQIPLDLVPAEKSNPGWKTILTPKPPPPPPPPKPEPREKPQRVKPPPPASSQSAPKTPHDKRKEAPVSLDKSLSTPAALVKPEGLREKRVAPAPQTSARLERSATTPATPSVASRSIPPSTPTPVAHAGTRAATAASPSGTLAAQATSSAAAASSAMTPAMAARAAIAAQSAKMLSSHTPAQPTATPTPAPPPLRRPPSPPPDPRDPNQLIVPASIRSPEAKKAPPVYVNRLSLFTPEEQTERQLPVDPLKAHAITVRRHVRRVVIRLSLSPWIVDGPGLTAAVPSPGGLGTTGVPFGTFGGPAEGAMGMSRGIAGAIGSMSGMTAGSPMLGSGGAFYSVPQPQPQLQHPTMTVTPLGPLPQMMPNHLSMPAGAAAGPIQAGQQPLSGRPPSPSMDSTLYYSILCQHNRMPARPTPDFTARPRTASQPHIVAGFQQQQQQQPQQQQPQQAAGAAAASLQVLPHPPQQLVAIPADLVEGLNAFEISVSVFQKGGAIAGGGGGVLADLAAQAGISVTGSGGSGPDLFVPLDGCRQKFFVFVQRFS
ncbi:hypothetical protein DFJ73DRAFT_228425 [Zopfochytrium polystomum]|nr:hypothetical protein DFJ73DRAFT_228425 [Zopfochytrium polystomum]